MKNDLVDEIKYFPVAFLSVGTDDHPIWHKTERFPERSCIRQADDVISSGLYGSWDATLQVVFSPDIEPLMR
ncbi:MAG: hypothetical protein M2R45_02511 [Verrucomicrobia subdivision 3 bacterium]|nr:hypothetical protein [Limisphaerales bacterium]MCS1414282.1 hypothetical protein [Limisphaerales bacterium]